MYQNLSCSCFGSQMHFTSHFSFSGASFPGPTFRYMYDNAYKHFPIIQTASNKYNFYYRDSAISQSCILLNGVKTSDTDARGFSFLPARLSACQGLGTAADLSKGGPGPDVTRRGPPCSGDSGARTIYLEPGPEEFVNLQGHLLQSSNWFCISSVQFSSPSTNLFGKFVQFSSGYRG